MTNIKNTRTMSLRLLGILFLLLFGFTLNIEKMYAISYIQVTGTVGASFLELDTSLMPEFGTYNAEGGYGTVADVYAWAGGVPAYSCTGGGCDPANPLLWGKPAEGSGLFWLAIWSQSQDTVYYALYEYNTDWEGEYVAQTTRILSINDPQENTVTNAGTPPFTGEETDTINIDLDIYFNSVEDYDDVDRVCVMLENMEIPNPQSYVPDCSTILASGISNHEFEFLNMPKGRYFAIAFFANDSFDKLYPSAWEFINIYTSVQNQSCLYGSAYLGVCPDPDLGEYATSTTPWVIEGLETEDCSVYSGTTEIPEKVGCALSNIFKNTVNVLFVPNGEQIQDLVTDVRENALNRFPIGYITDFVTVINNNATTTLTVLSATVPSVLPGGGSTITLNLNGVLDDFLNATTSEFFQVGETTTETWGEFTIRYWEYIVYVMTAFYIIRRIIGSNVMPWEGFGHEGSVSDTNSKDDSYKLKEWLYKHDDHKELIQTKSKFNQKLK